jgi:hypothetical protein
MRKVQLSGDQTNENKKIVFQSNNRVLFPKQQQKYSNNMNSIFSVA